MLEMKEKGRSEEGSRYQMYRKLNPELSKHEIYWAKDISEYKRISFSRFRTGSHRLKIETGRWSRIPRERRVCSCDDGGVQDEPHLIVNCSHLSNLRIEFPNLVFSVEGFFNFSSGDQAAYLFKALEILNTQ